MSLGPKGETRPVQPTAAERTVARRAAESRATIPHLELSVEAPEPRLATTPRLLRACAQALRTHPRVNAAYRDGQFELYSRVNIGLVVAAEESYLIPAVLDADQKTLEELAEETERLSVGAAAGELAPPAFSGATFTLWNAGEHQLASASIPLVPAQAAALVAGTAALTLVCDHRILYGAPPADFLIDVRRRLEQGDG